MVTSRRKYNMDNTKLIGSLHNPLKSYEDLLTVLSACFPFVWRFTSIIFEQHSWQIDPQSFIRRQLVYNLCSVSLPTTCENIVLLIGPLHMYLNSRGPVLTNFHLIFGKLYSLFGTKAMLAKTQNHGECHFYWK